MQVVVALLRLVRRMMGTVHTFVFVAVARLQGASVGKHLSAAGWVYFLCRGTFRIGSNVVIHSSFESNPVGGQTRTLIVVGPNAELTIGDNTGISNSAIFASTRISIGCDVLIGANCKIYDTDFHSLNPWERVGGSGTGARCAPVEIGDGAFVGAHTIVLKGVVIGPGSVIGAGSVVTKSVPAGQVWAGNPAKFVRALTDLGQG